MDKEKVVKGLECCTFILGKRKCNECPYQKGLPDNGCYQLQDDFHALLKEQEDLAKAVDQEHRVNEYLNKQLADRQKVIEQYRRADGFLQAHGWKW